MFNMAYFAIIVFFVIIILLAGYCCMKLFYPEVFVGDYAEFVTAIVALLAFIITIYEYNMRKDAKQAQVLSEYNKRYTEDPNVVKVVKYLCYTDKDGKINNPKPEKPSNYEVEMFMRFFEELELQIRCYRIEEKAVYDLFVYYANKLNDSKELRDSLGVTDYNENWGGFKEITRKYNDYKIKTQRL